MAKEGEQNFAYFFRLEKHRSITHYHQLNINGTLSNNPRQISDFCAKFHTELYSSKYNEEVSTLFLNNVKNLKTINVEDRSYCNSPFAVEEVSNDQLHINKSCMLQENIFQQEIIHGILHSSDQKGQCCLLELLSLLWCDLSSLQEPVERSCGGESHTEFFTY